MDALLNQPDIWKASLPHPKRDDHKYNRGHCVVLSGAELQTGASRLAATAALNNGAGAVTICGCLDALRIHAAHVTAIMLHEAASPEDFAALLAKRTFNAIILGPAAGVGEQTLARIDIARDTEIPLVLDADALTSMVGHINLRNKQGKKPVRCVMTPHAGEFAKLFAPLLGQDVQYAALPPALKLSKVEQARAAARIVNSVIVFKGFETVIAGPDGRAVVNTNGGPELATAGSGDVLSGLIGAHLAGNMPAFEAAAAAVWLHGYLGAKIGVGLTADRLVAAVKPLGAFLDP